MDMSEWSCSRSASTAQAFWWGFREDWIRAARTSGRQFTRRSEVDVGGEWGFGGCAGVCSGVSDGGVDVGSLRGGRQRGEGGSRGGQVFGVLFREVG